MRVSLSPEARVLRYLFAMVFVAAFAGALAGTRDDVDFPAVPALLDDGRDDDAALDFDPALDALDFAAVRRAGPRTSSSCPGWMTCFFSLFIRTIVLTLVPYFRAMPPSVSPRRTTCVRDPERELPP